MGLYSSASSLCSAALSPIISLDLFPSSSLSLSLPLSHLPPPLDPPLPFFPGPILLLSLSGCLPRSAPPASPSPPPAEMEREHETGGVGDSE
eukprot:1138125-Rhodomonas_salina.1